jgi:hypothetical protein
MKLFLWLLAALTPNKDDVDHEALRQPVERPKPQSSPPVE